jgi:hypothetical protein
MDNTNKIEEIQKELKAIKEKNPEDFTKASEKLSYLIKEYPAIKDDKKLMAMIVYAYIHVGDKIDDVIKPAFKEYDGPYKALKNKIKMDPEAINSYVFLALDSLILKMEKSHNVYVLYKGVPRDANVPNRNTGEMEKRKVLNMTVWIDDMKTMATLGIWDAQIPLYSNIEENKTYRMQLNYNGKAWYPATDPMAKEFEFKPDQEKIIDYVIDNYYQIKEPFSSVVENTDRTKTFYLSGRIIKESVGTIIIYPTFLTTSKISLMRTTDTMKLGDGENVIVVGNLSRSKPFTRNGQTFEATSHYTLYPNLVIRLDDIKDEDDTKPADIPQKTDSKQPSPDDIGL